MYHEKLSGFFSNRMRTFGVKHDSMQRPSMPLSLAGLFFLCLALFAATFASAQTPVFINEIHYDNTGIDAGEAIEIAGPAGTDLTGWSIVRYNGSTGAVYTTPSAIETFSGTIPNLGGGFGVVVLNYPQDGLQNGAPDGIALVDASNVVIQFLSYEGSFTAVGGPANGMVSIDIGVSEVSTTPVGHSLQLGGTGSNYEDFTWNSTAANTFGACNTGQTFAVPVVANAGLDKTICSGSSTTIGAMPAATGGVGGPYTFSWSPSDGLNQTDIANPTASPATTTTYTLTATEPGTGLTDMDEVTVTVNPLPTADAGPDEEICLDESVQIGGSPTGGTPPYTFVWSPSAGLDDATAENPNASPTNTTTYTVEITDANGCNDTDQVTVTVNPSPTADAGPDQEISAGQSVQIGGSPTGGTAPYTFVWSPSTGLDDATVENPTASPASTTTYTVEVTDANGCTDTDAMTVTVQDEEPEPVHDVVLLADDGISLDHHGASEGNLHSNEDIDIDNGAPSTLKGSLIAVDDIRIEEDNAIDGDVTAGDDLQVDDGVTITGAQTGNASVSSMALPTLSFATGGANKTVPQNGSLTLAPDSYGNVKVNKNGTLNLSSGDYFLKKLELKASATLVADVSDGPVKIHVETKLSFDKNVQVSITPGGESNTARVTFEFLGGARVSLGEQAQVLGNIIAPEATVELKKNSRFKGSICAELINVKEGAVFLHHTSSTPLPAKQNAPEDVEDIDSEEQITSLPTEYELAPNYPNPFNPRTTIKFAMPEAGTVALRIYSITGQLVRTLASGNYASGKYSLSWDATDGSGSPVATGIYFYQLVVQKQNGEAAFTQTRRMALVK